MSIINVCLSRSFSFKKYSLITVGTVERERIRAYSYKIVYSNLFKVLGIREHLMRSSTMIRWESEK